MEPNQHVSLNLSRGYLPIRQRGRVVQLFSYKPSRRLIVLCIVLKKYFIQEKSIKFAFFVGFFCFLVMRNYATGGLSRIDH